MNAHRKKAQRFQLNTLVLQHRMISAVDDCATGEMARAARIAAGLSLREMARRLNYSAPYVSDLEHGRRRWSGAKVDKWSAVLRRV